MYPTSSSSITIKARNRNGKILKDCRNDPFPTVFAPGSSLVFPSYIHIKQRCSPHSSCFLLPKPAGLDGREPFFCFFFNLKCIIICTACIFRRHIRRKKRGAHVTEKTRLKICGPHHVGFYIIGEAKLSEHCCTSLFCPLYLFLGSSFLHHGAPGAGGWGQGAGEVW